MDTTQIAVKKQTLRRLARQRISLLAAGYLSQAGREIARQVASLPEYQEADTVFAFCGTDREINTRPLLMQVLSDGKRLFLPRCTALGTIEAREIGSLDCLRIGRYGITEPPADSPVADPSAISLCLVPCLAADRNGNRLGHGGGYYDRYLPACHGAAILLCPEQLIMESIPRETHDYPFSVVVTERGITRRKAF